MNQVCILIIHELVDIALLLSNRVVQNHYVHNDSLCTGMLYPSGFYVEISPLVYVALDNVPVCPSHHPLLQEHVGYVETESKYNRFIRTHYSLHNFRYVTGYHFVILSLFIFCVYLFIFTFALCIPYFPHFQSSDISACYSVCLAKL